MLTRRRLDDAALEELEDLLIAADILASVTVLMVSLYLVKPVEIDDVPIVTLALSSKNSPLPLGEGQGVRAEYGQKFSIQTPLYSTIAALTLTLSQRERGQDVQ